MIDREYYTRKGGSGRYNFERKSGRRGRQRKATAPSRSETIHCEACGGWISEYDLGSVGGRCSRCGRKPDQSSWIGRPSPAMLAIVGSVGLFLVYFGAAPILRWWRNRGDAGARLGA